MEPLSQIPVGDPGVEPLSPLPVGNPGVEPLSPLLVVDREVVVRPKEAAPLLHSPAAPLLGELPCSEVASSCEVVGLILLHPSGEARREGRIVVPGGR